MTPEAAVQTPKSPTSRWKLATAWTLAALVLGAVAYLAWPSPSAAEVWKEAKAELDVGRFDAVLATLDRLARLRDPIAEDWLLRAQAEIGRERPDPALAALAKVPDAHPMAAPARLLAGQVELRRHRLAAAESMLIRAEILNPGYVQALRELIYVYGMQLRRPELNRTFLDLSKVVSLKASEVYLWTLTRGVSWEPEEVANYLAKCVAADPEDRHSRLALAESLRHLNRLAEAEATLSSLADSDFDALALRVRIAIDRGDDTQVDELLAQGPEGHAGLAMLRGRLALARGDGEKATRAFRTAYELDPTQRDAVVGLGRGLMISGDEKAAAPFLAKLKDYDRLEDLMQRAAIPRNREDLGLIRDLGAACEAVDRYPEARAWYNVAIAANPLDTEAQQGIASLPRR